ncbi:MAG: hypothetical protein U1G07_09525 [Verrucomicrobiota bacterium]
MKIDPLKQLAKLRQQLMKEKESLSRRLQEINQALGTPQPTPIFPRPGRGGNKMTLREAIGQALANGPLGRQELAQAVAELGYVSTAKNPLASMGVFLYARNSPFKRREGKFYLPHGSLVNGRSRTATRRMSPEARAKIAAAQRARWERQKRNKPVASA